MNPNPTRIVIIGGQIGWDASGRFAQGFVPQVRQAAGAKHLDPGGQLAGVFGPDDELLVDRLEEARPAGATLELGLALEQRQIAAGADKRARPFFVVEGMRATHLSALTAQHAELCRC